MAWDPSASPAAHPDFVNTRLGDTPESVRGSEYYKGFLKGNNIGQQRALGLLSKEEAEKETHLKIVKHLDKNDPSTFIIQPTPWHYSFFGIMKLDTSPTLSPFSLDPKGPQSFPKIKF